MIPRSFGVLSKAIPLLTLLSFNAKAVELAPNWLYITTQFSAQDEKGKWISDTNTLTNAIKSEQGSVGACYTPYKQFRTKVTVTPADTIPQKLEVKLSLLSNVDSEEDMLERNVTPVINAHGELNLANVYENEEAIVAPLSFRALIPEFIYKTPAKEDFYDYTLSKALEFIRDKDESVPNKTFAQFSSLKGIGKDNANSTHLLIRIGKSYFSNNTIQYLKQGYSEDSEAPLLNEIACIFATP